MPRLVKATPLGDVTVNVSDETAKRLIVDEHWLPSEAEKKPEQATRRRAKTTSK